MKSRMDSLFLVFFLVGIALGCIPVGDPGHVLHPGHPERTQGSAGPPGHTKTCDDGPPILAPQAQRIEPSSPHSHQSFAQQDPIGREGWEARVFRALPAFLQGFPSPSQASVKLYKLHLSYLI